MGRYEDLIEMALDARRIAYAPYSKFKVGAALLGSNGVVYMGCNVENASYPATNCAERTAIFSAVAEGQKEFEAIAIVGGNEDASELELCAPCGICRQVIEEFAEDRDMKIYIVKNENDYIETTLNKIMPEGFSKEDLIK